MTDQELNSLIADLIVAQQKTDEQLKSLHEKLDHISVMLSGICDVTNAFFDEEEEAIDKFFYNSLVKSPCLGSISFAPPSDSISMNTQYRNGNIKKNYDLLMISDSENAIAIIETRFKADESDLEILEHKMRGFKELSPSYQNYKLYGAIAAFYISDEAKREALKRGFFVLQRNGELLHTDCAENLLVL